MTQFFPSRLCKVKTFESVEARTPCEGGWARFDNLSTPTIETQVDAWVDQTKALITGTGPLMVMEHEEKTNFNGMTTVPVTINDQKDSWAGNATLTVVTRTLSVIYIPAVEQADGTVRQQPYGQSDPLTAPEQQQARPPVGPAVTSGPSVANPANVGGLAVSTTRARATLRLPPAGITALPGRPGPAT